MPSNQSEVSRDMSHYGAMRLVGFSDKPTPYRMILPQRGDVYVKCGADILLNGLKTDLKAEARCPVCGKVTRFHIDQRRIEDLSPKDPTLHVVDLQMWPGHLGVGCESTHIFDRKECLAKWLSTYTDKTDPSNLATRIHGFSEPKATRKMS